MRHRPIGWGVVGTFPVHNTAGFHPIVPLAIVFCDLLQHLGKSVIKPIIWRATLGPWRFVRLYNIFATFVKPFGDARVALPQVSPGFQLITQEEYQPVEV